MSVGSGGGTGKEVEMESEPMLDLEQMICVESSIDGSIEPSRLLLPEGTTFEDDPRPLVVSLHWWSRDYTQQQPELEQLVLDQGWIYVAPNYRGPNNRPEACGSALAQQDILDVIDWLIANYPVDSERVYITGVSGGGHMTMMMAARHPERFAAASAWASISDLVAWHDFHSGQGYGDNIQACAGGAPGDSVAVDLQYEARSPINHIQGAAGLALDIATGRYDGHDGNSVPIHHSLDAFNVVADAVGALHTA